MTHAASSASRNLDLLSDEDLVHQAKAGAREAFATIMRRHNQRLFRVARGLMRDEAEAEDVVQEAYFRAFSALSTFRGEARLSSWLTQITLNEARGRLRKRRQFVTTDAIEAAQAQGVIMFPKSLAMATPEAEAARAQTRALMEGAIDRLPEAFRLVFLMRAVEECTVEETAEHLSLRPQTVKTRFFRARRLLRKSLEDQLSSSVTEAFPFLGTKCQNITQAVLARLTAEGFIPAAQDRID